MTLMKGDAEDNLPNGLHDFAKEADNQAGTPRRQKLPCRLRSHEATAGEHSGEHIQLFEVVISSVSVVVVHSRRPIGRMDIDKAVSSIFCVFNFKRRIQLVRSVRECFEFSRRF